jgi:uncharacterized protein (DUF2062 family)
MKRMFHAWVVLAMFSVVLFHGPLVIDASGILAKTPVKVVVVSGTNYEMGVQYGEQAAKFIKNRAEYPACKGGDGSPRAEGTKNMI